MKKFLLILLPVLVFCIAPQAIGQNDKTKATEKAVKETLPEFSGGSEAITAFLAKEIQYPKAAEEKGLKGVVKVKFVVAKDGSVKNATVTKSLSPECDKEAIRAVMAMPKWKPATLDGEPVNTYLEVPVIFEPTK